MAAAPPTPPYFTVRTLLHAPKEGNTEEQYEDAFACSESLEEGTGVPRLTVALADGASSAVFARQWANLLARTFADTRPFPATDDRAHALVADLGRAWRESVTGKARSWYAQEKLPSGSSAALLVADWDADRGTVRAHAVGDACLFVVRGDRLRFGFPVRASRAFTDRPPLLSTETQAESPPFLRFETPVEPGDRCLLMTDALAAYFLAEFEARRKPWNALPEDAEGFACWLKEKRDCGAVKNDDSTVVEVVTLP